MKSYIFFDLEASSADPNQAEILQIAAYADGREPFNAFVQSKNPPPEDSDIWKLVDFSRETYFREARSPEKVFEEFLEYIESGSLAGHNIHAFDLPVLNRWLQEFNLGKLDNSALDTLRLAHLVFPVPPENLTGYKLADLYRYFTGNSPVTSHDALADVLTNVEVARHLKRFANAEVDSYVRTVWSALNIEEAKFLNLEDPSRERVIEALQKTLNVDANIPWVPPSESSSFPAVWENPEQHLDLLGEKREVQLEMMRHVHKTLKTKGEALLIEAPTGTGKTRGYLFPILHVASNEKGSGKPFVVATHTKLLQMQAIDELQSLFEKGYSAGAVYLKSARDYLCLDALKETFGDREHLNDDARAAVGVLVHYASNGGYDLEALPAYWRSRAGFREVFYRVQTNPKRCGQGPEHRHCAYTLASNRKKRAKIWITNQAWLLAHQAAFTKNEEKEETEACCHLVVDEAHNLEGQATATFSKQVSGEELMARIKRLYDPARRTGLFRDRGRLNEILGQEPPEPLVAFAKELREKHIVSLLKSIASLGKDLIFLIKNYGQGDPKYDVRLDLVPAVSSKREWGQIEHSLSATRQLVADLLKKLRQLVPRGSRLYFRLDPLFDVFDRFIELSKIAQTAAAGHLDEKEWVAELVYAGDTWTILAQPVDLVEHLAPLWLRTEGAVFTSATLDLGDDFAYIKRALGIEQSFGSHNAKKLPGVLPYEKAHLVIPGHLPEARGNLQKQFSRLLEEELSQLLPYTKRSLNLFTSSARLKETGSRLKERLGDDVILPLTRKEREDAVQRMRADPKAPGHTFGSRSFMEGVDLPNLKLVGLERIPFPVPNRLLEARGELAEQQGLDRWDDVYMPKATLSFVQAFGRLIRDDRTGVGEGVFILWDKRIVNAFYQTRFFDALPDGVKKHFPKTRKKFYDELAPILGVERVELPTEELLDGALKRLYEIRESEIEPLEKAVQIANVFWEGVDLAKEGEREKKQREAIGAALSGKNLFIFLPTGYGKSLTFQLPAFVEEGLTIVVSPLKALMADQVNKLQDRGLPAAKVDSSMVAAERAAVYEEVRNGRINLLYLSPERIVRDQELRSLVKEEVGNKRLKRFVFDEAHSVWEWGHDFRPDYLDAVKLIRDKLAPDVPITALTATAVPHVREKLYNIFNFAPENVSVVEAHLDRPEIKYYIYRARGKAAPIQKLSEVAQLLTHLNKKYGNNNWSSIVYVNTRRHSERLAWALGRLGFRAEAYHAGLGDLIRLEVQDRFEEGTTPIVVATKAFGMGIDKHNVRAVVHFEPPESIEAYLQGSGRAGRDGKDAYALLCHAPKDWSLVEWMVTRWGYDENHVSALVEIVGGKQALGWIGYTDSLVEEVNTLASMGRADAESEKWEIDENDLRLILGRAASFGVINYDFLPGRAAVLKEDCGLVEHLGIAHLEGERCLLDFTLLGNPEIIVEKYNWLYSEWRKDRLQIIRSYEPALHLRLINRRNVISLRNHTRELLRRAKERVKGLKDYAKYGGCYREFLLRYQGAAMSTCSGCGYHDGDPPWGGEQKLDNSIILDAYRPKEVILEFLQWMQDGAESWQRQGGKERQFTGYGSAVIANALIGNATFWTGKEPRILPKWLKNRRFFGKLAFVTREEINKQLKELVETGLIEAESYLSGHVYRISEAGRKELARLMKRAIRGD